MLNHPWPIVNRRDLAGPDKPTEFYPSPKPFKPKIPTFQRPVKRPRAWIVRARPGRR
jgi:hypothetical protein